MRGARRAASASPSERSRAPTGVAARVGTPRVERLRSAAAFERVLRTRPLKMSAHFAVHHLAADVGTARAPGGEPLVPDLSTDLIPTSVQIVDDYPERGRAPALTLGLVVPKRHARRAATRSLVKRQMRAVFGRHVVRLPAGAWVLRLRAPLDAAHYRSAVSAPLRALVRTELEEMVAACTQGAAA